jgi:hypothetical protein
MGRFQPGQSGNPAGSRRGSKHRVTMLAETLLDAGAEALVRKCIEMAMSGDTAAMRVCMDRILPIRRGRVVTLALPPVRKPADLVTALGAIAEAVSAGELTPEEGGALSAMLEVQRKSFELVEIEARLKALEDKGR